MLIQRVSPFSYRLNAMELDITLEQITRYAAGGVLIQDAFPNLTAEQREFYKTGITPDEWEALAA